MYVSPLASEYTNLLNKFKLLLLEVELPPPLDELLIIPIAFKVLVPAIPSTVSPFDLIWKKINLNKVFFILI